MKVVAGLRSPAFRWGLFVLLVIGAFALQLLTNPWRAYLPGAESGFGLREYRDTGLILAAVFGAPLLGFLILLWPTWLPFFLHKSNHPEAGPAVGSRWLWLSPCLAALLLLSFAIPRLEFSFWEDEDVAVRKFIAGQYEKKKDGIYRVDPTSWDETLFGYWRPTNHVPQSALSKASHEIWRALNPDAGFAFSEAAVRLPALVCGVLVLFAVFVLVRQMGFPVAAAAVPFLFALHPWLIRFSSEARGYSLAFLALAVVLTSGLALAQTRSITALILFPVSSAIAVWAYPGLLGGLALVWLVLMAWLLIRRPAEWDLVLVRLGVVTLVVAAGFLPLALPLAPQFLEYTRSESQVGEMGMNWLSHAMSYNFVGSPRVVGDPADPDLAQLASAWARYGVLANFVFILILVFGAAGLVGLARRTPLGLLMLLALFAGAALTYWNAERSGFRLHEWYLYFLMLPVLVLPAIGMDAASRLLPSPAARASAAVMLALLIGAYAAGTEPIRAATLTDPHMPIREGYLIARGALDPNAPGQSRIVTLAAEPTPRLYDPRVTTVKTASDIDDAIAALPADGEIYLLVRFRAVGDPEYQGAIEAAQKKGFTIVREFDAAFPFEHRFIYRYSPEVSPAPPENP